MTSPFGRATPVWRPLGISGVSESRIPWSWRRSGVGPFAYHGLTGQHSHLHSEHGEPMFTLVNNNDSAGCIVVDLDTKFRKTWTSHRGLLPASPPYHICQVLYLSSSTKHRFGPDKISCCLTKASQKGDPLVIPSIPSQWTGKILSRKCPRN